MKLRLKTIDKTPTINLAELNTGLNRTFDYSQSTRSNKVNQYNKTTSLSTRKVSTTDTPQNNKWPFYQSVLNTNIALTDYKMQ